MYANLGPGQIAERDPPSPNGVDVLYSHEYVAERMRERNLYGYCNNDPLTKADPSGLKPNDRRPGGIGYYGGWDWPCNRFCNDKPSRLSPIPGITTIPYPGPAGVTGPGWGGSNETYGFPATPPGPIGSGGASGCIILVVKCGGTVRVFHFTGGDSPSDTLDGFAWAKGCQAIICGGDNTPQSNYGGDDVMNAATAAGITVVGVSGGSGCGVTAAGGWYEVIP